MRLTPHDLMQLDNGYLESLTPEALRNVSKKLLADLKEAVDRLNQNSNNSSVPPSSRPSYLGIPFGEGSDLTQDSDETIGAKGEVPKAEAKQKEDNHDSPKDVSTGDESSSCDQSSNPRRKPGKQVGAPGFGRSQRMTVHRIEEHRPVSCSACDQPLPGDTPFVVHLGFHVLDLQRGDSTQPGMQLICTLHRYGEVQCRCGHVTRVQPGQGTIYQPENRKLPTALGEWRLIGPTLSSLIVCLSFRMRLSRSRIQEFLQDWLNLRLSTGTIHNCISEAGLAAAPVEKELIEEVRKSGLLFVDETPWKEWGKVLWLWVFVAGPVVLFLVGRRTRQVLTQVLGDLFAGWLMSDGHVNYRDYHKRLRCHAHLMRKATGLYESVDKEAAEFGKIAMFTLTMAYRQIKGKLTPTNLYSVMLSNFKAFCELHKGRWSCRWCNSIHALHYC